MGSDFTVIDFFVAEERFQKNLESYLMLYAMGSNAILTRFVLNNYLNLHTKCVLFNFQALLVVTKEKKKNGRNVFVKYP